MPNTPTRNYFYLRSGFIHRVRKVELDEAIQLSDEENEKLKETITNSSLHKAKILGDLWEVLAETENREIIDFKKYLDKKGAEKRAYYDKEEQEEGDRLTSKSPLKKDHSADRIRYFVPIVETLEELGGSGRPSEVTNLIIERYNFTKEELEQRNENGEPTIKNRIAWARFYLAKGGVLDSTQKGIWRLTKDYKMKFDKNNPDSFYKMIQQQFDSDRKN